MIYHIATRKEWDSHAGAAAYVPFAYDQDEFIHCCDLHQLAAVANEYFPGGGELLVLELAPTKLEPQTIYEQNGKEKYPHVYGPINKDAINRVLRVQRNANGLFDGAFDELAHIAVGNSSTAGEANVKQHGTGLVRPYANEIASEIRRDWTGSPGADRLWCHAIDLARTGIRSGGINYAPANHSNTSDTYEDRIRRVRPDGVAQCRTRSVRARFRHFHVQR